MAYNRSFNKPQAVKQPRVMRSWSKYQQDIFADIANGVGNTQVDALAGTGKTSTIVEGFYYVPKNKNSLMCAFNKSIQTELEARAPSEVTVKTLHGLGYAACRRSFPKIGQPDSKKLDSYIKADRGDEDNYELRTNLAKAISLAKGYLANSPQEIDEIIDRHQVDICSDTREQFTTTVLKVMEATKKDTNRVDFDDMIWLPNVLNLRLEKYGMVFIDEAQDLNSAQINLALNSVESGGKVVSMGDQHQCVDIYTNVAIENNINKTAGELVPGDKILSYRNGENVYQTVTKVWETSETEGVKITTSSGKSLSMTNKHQIWASLPEFSNTTDSLVYLMYRSGFGFRVGITNKSYSPDSSKNFSSRLTQESGDKMWILDWVNSREDALLKELSYSLQYGIPTCVFKGESRGLNQNHINNIFNKFGANGINLLNDRGMSEHHPHWHSASSTKGSIKRNVITFVEHNKKGSQVCLEWSEKESNFCKTLKENNIVFTKAKGENRFRIRKFLRSNRDALEFAIKLQSILGLDVSRTLSNNETRLNLLTASSLLVGMKVVVKDGSSFKLESISKIEKINGKFVDIEVHDAANFYGNDILSHNSIYSFRGADSNAINNIVERLNAKRLPLNVTYRCAKSIVSIAQTLVPEIEAAPNAEEGSVDEIAINQMEHLVKPGDFILSRVNAPLIKWCLALLKARVPANIQGRDMGQQLTSLIKKSNKKTVTEFLSWLEEYENTEVDRLTKIRRDSSVIVDKAECLRVLCDGSKTLDEVRDNINHLFKDGDDKDRVILSSTHKAKGLERDRVFMLKDTYKIGKGVEENNLAYVAYTRARKQLFLVSGK